MTLTLYVFSLVILSLFGFIDIKTFSFKTIHLQGPELEKKRLADNFIGQEMTFSSSNPLLIIEPGVIEIEPCPDITGGLKQNEFIQDMKIYEDVDKPFRWRVLFVSTTNGRVLMVELKCRNSTNCTVHECEPLSSATPFIVSWGQTGKEFVLLSLIGLENLSIRLIDPTDSMCATKNQFFMRDELSYSIPLDDTKVLGEYQDRLRIKTYKPGDRSLYINVPPPENPIQDIAILFPFVFTLETVTSKIRILKYVEEYEDLVQLSTIVIPKNEKLVSLYVTLHDRSSLYATCKESDTVYLFNIENPEFPKIAKIFYDPDYIIPTDLPYKTQRISMSQDFIVILAGKESNIILRAINKNRGINNYIVKDISLGLLTASVSLVVLNYYDNLFAVSIGNKMRVFRFTEQNLILNGEKLIKFDEKATHIQASIQVRNKFKKLSLPIDIYVYPDLLEFVPVSVKNPSNYTGYEGNWLDIDISKFFISNAMNISLIEGDNNMAIHNNSLINFLDKSNRSVLNGSFYEIVRLGSEMIIAEVCKVNNAIVVRYYKMTRYGHYLKKEIKSIEYKKKFNITNVAFSQDLDLIYIQTDFFLEESNITLLYFAGDKYSLIHYVTEMNKTDNPLHLCETLKMQYEPEHHYLFAVDSCSSNEYTSFISRYKFDPGRPSSVTDIQHFTINSQYIIKYYIGSEVFAGYVKRNNDISVDVVEIIFSEPFFRNIHSNVKFDTSFYSYRGSFFSKKKVIVLLTSIILTKDCIREYLVPTASTPYQKRTIPLPDLFFFYFHEKNDLAISDFLDNFLVLVAFCKIEPCLLIYNLENMEHNALYYGYSLSILEERPMDVRLIRGDDYTLYIMLYTNTSLYRFSMNTNYNIKMRMIESTGSKDVYETSFKVYMQSLIELNQIINFTVNVKQIPAPSNMQISKTQCSTSSGKLNISDFVDGYDVYVGMSRPVNGVKLLSREFINDVGGTKRDIQSLAEDVESVISLNRNMLLFTKESSYIQLYELEKGVTHVKVVDLIGIRVAKLGSSNGCIYVAIYTSQPYNSSILADLQKPQLKIGRICGSENIEITDETLVLSYPMCQNSRITGIHMNSAQNLLYIIMSPDTLFHNELVSNVIVVASYQVGNFSLPKPEYNFTEHNFAESMGSFKINTATMAGPSLFCALDSGNLISINLLKNGDEKFGYKQYEITAKDGNFEDDNHITAITYVIDSQRLVVLYESAGLAYCSLETMDWVLIPAGHLTTKLKDLYVDNHILLVSGTAREGEVALVYFWQENKYIPKLKIIMGEFCVNLQGIWTSYMTDEEFEQSGSIQIYIYCNGVFSSMIVNKWTTLSIDYDTLPPGETRMELIATTPLTWDYEKIEVYINNENGYLWKIITSVVCFVLVIGGTIIFVLYRRYRKKIEKQKKEEDAHREFLFGTPILEKSLSGDSLVLDQ